MTTKEPSAPWWQGGRWRRPSAAMSSRCAPTSRTSQRLRACRSGSGPHRVSGSTDTHNGFGRRVLDSGGLGANVVREVQSLFKAIEKEGLQAGKGDNHKVGRPRHIHDPGIQQEL